VSLHEWLKHFEFLGNLGNQFLSRFALLEVIELGHIKEGGTHEF
jgi:hypothetical protein